MTYAARFMWFISMAYFLRYGNASCPTSDIKSLSYTCSGKKATTRGKLLSVPGRYRQSAYETAWSRPSLQKAWWMLTCIFPPTSYRKTVFGVWHHFLFQKQLNILSIPLNSRLTTVIMYEDIFEHFNIPEIVCHRCAHASKSNVPTEMRPEKENYKWAALYRGEEQKIPGH